MKKNNAVVFGGTGNQVFAMACVMMDLKRLSPGLVDEVVIYHDGITRKDAGLLRRILPTRLIRYKFPIKNRKRFNQGTLGHFSEMVFSKFEAFRLLDDYRNVLFTDYDIVIREAISELLAPCASGIKLLPAEQSVGETLHYPVEEFDMGRKGHSVAFIALHDNLTNYAEIHRWCYQMTEQYAPNLYLPEQAIVNFAVEKFGLKPVHHDADIYCLHPRDLKRVPNPKVLHAYGTEKFWSGLPNDQWQANYQRWLDWGGSPNRPRRVPWTAQRQWDSFKRLLKAWVGR